jgi:hypothetical protein
LKPDIVHIEIPTINNIVNTPMLPPISNSDNTSPNIELELKRIRDNIDSVKNNTKIDIEGDNASLNNHDVHHYVAIYVIASAGIAVCLVYCVRKVRGRVEWRTPAAPASESPAPAPPQPRPRAHNVTLAPHHKYPSERSDHQCASVNDNNQVNASAFNDRVYARMTKVKLQIHSILV